MAYIMNSENPEEVFELPEIFSIGTSTNCHLQLNGPKVAEKHCRLEKKDDGFLLRDLRSGFGTRVNGKIVLEKFMSENDEIEIDGQYYLYSERPPIQRELGLWSKNPFWAHQLRLLSGVAATDYPVLLLGPSGSGKEIVAQALHEHSDRGGSEFVSVNCSALTDTLIESELFGHVKGSFTGAIADRKGAFEAARGGTIFLDEIGDLPYTMQAKLLRALENSEIRPVGSDKTIRTNVRVIAATHQNLMEKIGRKEFRGDLYFRLNVVTAHLPSLAQRMEDFDDLLEFFCKKYRVRFSPTAALKMKQHAWPGNIRELKNAVTRACAFFPRTRIEEKHLDYLIDKIPIMTGSLNATPMASMPMVKEMEKQLIIKTLSENFGNQRMTAKNLGIPKSTLHDRIKSYDLNIKEICKKATPSEITASTPLSL